MRRRRKRRRKIKRRKRRRKMEVVQNLSKNYNLYKNSKVIMSLKYKNKRNKNNSNNLIRY